MKLPDRFADQPSWVRPFILAVESGETVSDASVVAGVNRDYVYAFRQRNARFFDLFEEARRIFLETAEGRLARRALDGEEEIVVHGGRVAVVMSCCQMHPDDCSCAEKGKKQPLKVRRPNDTLLMFQLKALAPEKYRENHMGGAQEPEKPTPPEEDIEKFARAIESVLSDSGS